MAITIKDVAKETNLSISTISKYINGGNVRPYNKKKIDEAINKLQFHPSNYARGLRNSKSYTIGIVIDSLGSQYFAKITQLIEKQLAEIGYSLIVCCHRDNAATAKETLKFLEEKQVDGIIFEPVACKEDCIIPNHYNDIPIIAIDRPLENGTCDCITSNSATGIYRATEYLIQNNHKKIAIITGLSKDNLGLTIANERYNGYLRAMEDYNIPINNDYVLMGNFKFESGYECMQKLWGLKDHPTALIISNYNMCLGVMTAIHNIKIKVPDELSLITFDDLEFSVISSPKLTSIRQPMEIMAKEVVKLILRRISGDNSDYPKYIKLPTELVIRNSVIMLNNGGIKI